MIKGFGGFSFFVFLVLCLQIGEFGPGFAIWFLSFLLIGSGIVADALFLYPKSFEERGFKKILAFAAVSPVNLVNTITEIAGVVRKDGLLATESLRKDLKDPWLVYALKKMIDGYEKSVIVQVIRNEHLHFHEQFLSLEKYKERVSGSIALFGLAGSLSHIIHFLSKDDPTLIAASFIPFLLSSLIQIVFNAWAQSKIDFLTDQHRVYYAILENGISGIQDGINADVLRDQLMARIDHA
jgi:flagellar motor component MotA